MSTRTSRILGLTALALASSAGMMSGSTMAAAFARAELAAPDAPSTPSPQDARPRTTAKWNLAGSAKLAIDGYDPVAYFPQGGGTPTKGDDKITLAYRGALYRFKNQANKALFEADPSAFEPAHGGWCSWAMREGDQVDIDPESFIVRDGRLFLFYKGWLGDTRAKWSKGDHAAETKEADAQWKKLSGELPPAPKTMTPSTAPAMAPTMNPATPVSLNVRLKEVHAKLTAKVPAEQLAKYESGIKTLADSGITAKALAVGAQAPDFELQDIRGETRSLKSMLAQGPVVVTFYRGSWCPFCVAQLGAYEEALAEMKSLGAQLVAISPQTPENSKATARSLHLTSTVLSDTGNTVAKKFGVAYAMPASSAEAYRPLLSKANGDESLELPMAATYVIARDGRVAYAYVNADYRERAEPSEIVSALKAFSSAK